MILFLTDPAPDYGQDFLFDGCMRLFGIERVIDWPAKPSLHGQQAGFDCDLNWPRLADFDEDWFVPDLLATTQLGKQIELLVVPTLRGDMHDRLGWFHHQGHAAKLRDRTVYYDGEDHDRDTVRFFTGDFGFPPTASFKRELPFGATWARPLPFGYPEDRIVDPARFATRAGFHYNAYIWEWARDGLRDHLGRALAHMATAADMELSAMHPDDRFGVATQHETNRGALVAISPAGAGWGTNRHLEIIADGCAPVLQRPTVEFPEAFHHGTECLYFDGVTDCLAHVRELLGNPAYALGMAQAAQARLRQHHTTTVRARTVWEAVHGRR